jgi:hypothetical protein
MDPSSSRVGFGKFWIGTCALIGILELIIRIRIEYGDDVLNTASIDGRSQMPE